METFLFQNKDGIMNRKNPGLVEPETMSKEEEHQHYRLLAVAWTIASVLFTAYAFWKGTEHLKETACFGWFMAAWSWGFWWYEERKAGRGSLSKKRQPVKEDKTRG